jgi:hypothetical protein
VNAFKGELVDHHRIVFEKTWVGAPDELAGGALLGAERSRRRQVRLQVSADHAGYAQLAIGRKT